MVGISVILVSWCIFEQIGCEPKKGGTSMKATTAIRIQSEAFQAGAVIPKKYTGDGSDISPGLKWDDLPEGTKELALIMDDPDAPMAEPFVHWVMYKIPAETRDIPEDVPDAMKISTPFHAYQGKNSFGTIGYRGPMPPRGHGVHHYHFKLYALDAELDLRPGSDKKALLKAMEGHILSEGELVGTYERE
jgi:Raf kinase inhibitor-like YbhB/YbcL family protein